MSAARSYEDYDGTTIYLTPPVKPDPSDIHNLEIVEVIRKHTMDIAFFNPKFATSWCKSSDSSPDLQRPVNARDLLPKLV